MIRKATLQDVDAILAIIEQAKLYLKSQQIDQWQNGYPNRESIIQDIHLNQCFVYEFEGIIIATAALVDDIDPNYAYIEHGQWLSNDSYIAIHRVACLEDYKGQGFAGKIVDYAKKMNKNLRIDTHEANLSMQKMILKNGFQYCGIVYMADGAKRNAYEWVRGD